MSVHSAGAGPPRARKPPPASSGRAGHLPSCHQVAWPELVRTHSTVELQVVPTGSQAHRGTTVHSQRDQECEKAGAQWKMSRIAPLTISCPGPEHRYHSNLYVPHLATLLLKVSSAVDGEKASDRIKNVAMTALQKGSFCFWDTYSLRLSVTRYVLVVCRGLSGTSGWTTCGVRFANRRHGAPGFPSRPNSSQKIPKQGPPWEDCTAWQFF